MTEQVPWAWGLGLTMGAGIAAAVWGAGVASAAPADAQTSSGTPSVTSSVAHRSSVSARRTPDGAQARTQPTVSLDGGNRARILRGNAAAVSPARVASRNRIPVTTPAVSPAVGGDGSAAAAAVVQPAGDYVLIRRSDLMSKPTSGPGWDFLKAQASAVWETPELSKLDTKTPAMVMAAALVYARTGDVSYRDKVIAAITKVPGTEKKTDVVLPFARNVFGYVVAADLVGMPLNSVTSNGQTWLAFLQQARTEQFPGNTRWISLEKTSGDSAGNWNAYALSSHLAISIVLGDEVAAARDIAVYRRFLGDTTSPWPAFNPTTGYSWNNNGRTWDLSPTLQRGINPDKPGDPRSGAIIVDALRHTTLTSVACCKVDLAGRAYTEETLDALMAINMVLKARGMDFTDFQNQAIRRAYAFLARNGGPSGYSNGRFLALAMNNLYGTSYSTAAGDSVARHLGFGRWLVTR